MKQKLLAGLTTLALAPAVFGADAIWENKTQYVVPSTAHPFADQIDALTFYNYPGAVFDITGSSIFETYDTLNWTNKGIMTGFPGFNFETIPTGAGVATRGLNFANVASGFGNGVINCNGTFAFTLAPGLVFGNLVGTAKLMVNANNIVNSGAINTSASSLLQFKGSNLDLSRGSLMMANPNNTFIFGTNIITLPGINALFSSGILDGWWGARGATNAMLPSSLLGGITPLHVVTNRNYLVYLTEVATFQPTIYINDTGIVGSNRFVQAVFLSNFDPRFVNSVFFTPAQIAVQWQWTTPNWPAVGITTNYMYLTDNFGEVTNIGVVANGTINPQAPFPKLTYKPENYNFVDGQQFSTTLPPATAGLLPGVFDSTTTVTNQYASYEAIFTPGTQLPTDVAGGNVTNMGGRIELIADNTLNLKSSRISSLNYLLLKATNHFLGSPNAVISTPNADMYLRTTNGILSVTNLIAPFLAHPQGFCELWSGRWTNVVNNITNSFHVLFVESDLQALGTPLIQTIDLTVTNFANSGSNNLIISDILNVTSNFVFRVERLTIATNGPDAFNPTGMLNFYNANVVWPNATPRLQYLTNWGAINTFNTVYFGGSHTQPPYNTNLVDVPYQAFVNHGSLFNSGSQIYSIYFENTGGTVDADVGSIQLYQCANAVLRDGFFNAGIYGQVTLQAGNLVVSNHSITAGSSLELYVTNSISDGGAPTSLTNIIFGGLPIGNFWTAGDGFSLYVKPTTGDLLNTLVFNTAQDYAETANFWAGEDRGASVAGFTNNCAVGNLILDGGTNSSFHFIATGAVNALYVDLLDLRDFTTNRDSSGNFIGLNIDPNMTVYFADAVVDGESIAEKLNGKNGGRLVWVSTYAGLNTSTNLLYPDGNIYTFNRALVQSCNLDSDGDGIANCSDATPILVPGLVHLSVTLTNSPKAAMVLRWPTLASSTNTVFYKGLMGATNWQTLTNFIFGPNNGQATVLDPLTRSNRLYRVRVDTRR